jgi:Na+/H+ antiporter NhaD/arsenite permease-like protein
MVLQYTQYFVLGLTYLGLVLGHFPGLRMNRLLGAIAILSNIISNVPAVLLIEPLIQREDTRSWLLLAAGSTLAGNLTLFGAVANLITVEAAAKLGYKLSFWEHLRFGFPLTAITLVIAYFWLNFSY